jgi:hypothetical protein
MQRGGIAAAVGLGALLVYLTTAGGSLATEDAVAMYEEGKAILDRGAVSVPASVSVPQWRGENGAYYTPFGIGQPLYDVPFIAAGRVVTRVTGITLGTPDAIPKACVALGSAFAAAAAVAFTFLLGLELGGRTRGSVLAAFAAAFGTLLWPYSKFGFNAAVTAAALSGGVWGFAAAVRTGRTGLSIAGGLLLGFALLTRHEMALAASAACVWLWLEKGTAAIFSKKRGQPSEVASSHTVSAVPIFRKKSRLSPFSAACGISAVVACAVAAGIYNAVRFGGPLSVGYTPAYSGAGFAGLTLSPAGAIFLYSPPAIAVVLLFRVRRQAAGQLLLAVCVILAVYYGLLDDWLGTRSYGPRYLVPILPLAVAPLALADFRSRLRRLAIVSIVAAGVLVQMPAVAVDFSRAGIHAGQPPADEREYSWKWAALPVTSREAARLVPDNIRFIARGQAPAIDRNAATLQQKVDFSLDLWWLYLYYLGVLHRGQAVLIAMAFLGGGAAAWAIADRSARTEAVQYEDP